MQNFQKCHSENDSTTSNCDDIFCTNSQCPFANRKSVVLQVSELNRTIACLKNTIQIKDAQLKSMHLENERLLGELRKQQRCNRNIKQQLNNGKWFCRKGKECCNDKIQCVNGVSNVQERNETLNTLIAENKCLRQELNEKSETTYNLCIKFLRMKHAKDTLRQKLDQLLSEHLQIMTETMEKLDEARVELNVIVSEKFQEPLPLSKAKFLQVVQRNARLVHENALLKVQIQHLNLNIEKLKRYAQKPKLINIDEKIITKLSTQSKKKV